MPRTPSRNTASPCSRRFSKSPRAVRTQSPFREFVRASGQRTSVTSRWADAGALVVQVVTRRAELAERAFALHEVRSVALGHVAARRAGKRLSDTVRPHIEDAVWGACRDREA